MTEPALAAPRGAALAELWQRTSWRVVVFIAACVLVGGIGGLVWSSATPLARYTIKDDLSVGMSERAMAQLIAPDVSFCLITGIIGLAIGLAGWFTLHLRGWVVVVAPLVAAFGASLMAWRLGLAVGVSDFADRLAAASAGDTVRVNLDLHSMSALLVAPFAAITPIMLLAAFWPERRADSADTEPSPAD